MRVLTNFLFSFRKHVLIFNMLNMLKSGMSAIALGVHVQTHWVDQSHVILNHTSCGSWLWAKPNNCFSLRFLGILISRHWNSISIQYCVYVSLYNTGFSSICKLAFLDIAKSIWYAVGWKQRLYIFHISSSYALEGHSHITITVYKNETWKKWLNVFSFQNCEHIADGLICV